ncbi:STAS domain-containing protein [Azospirillum sp. sgz301742]
MDTASTQSCHVRRNDDISYLNGRLTFETYPSMRATLDGILRHRAPRHVIDVSALQHIDSAGLGMLLIASEEMKRANKILVLRAATGQVRRVLEVTRMNTLMVIED